MLNSSNDGEIINIHDVFPIVMILTVYNLSDNLVLVTNGHYMTVVGWFNLHHGNDNDNTNTW